MAHAWYRHFAVSHDASMHDTLQHAALELVSCSNSNFMLEFRISLSSPWATGGGFAWLPLANLCSSTDTATATATSSSTAAAATGAPSQCIHSLLYSPEHSIHGAVRARLSTSYAADESSTADASQNFPYYHAGSLDAMAFFA